VDSPSSSLGRVLGHWRGWCGCWSWCRAPGRACGGGRCEGSRAESLGGSLVALGLFGDGRQQVHSVGHVGRGAVGVGAGCSVSQLEGPVGGGVGRGGELGCGRGGSGAVGGLVRWLWLWVGGPRGVGGGGISRWGICRVVASRGGVRLKRGLPGGMYWWAANLAGLVRAMSGCDLCSRRGRPRSVPVRSSSSRGRAASRAASLRSSRRVVAGRIIGRNAGVCGACSGACGSWVRVGRDRRCGGCLVRDELSVAVTGPGWCKSGHLGVERRAGGGERIDRGEQGACRNGRLGIVGVGG